MALFFVLDKDKHPWSVSGRWVFPTLKDALHAQQRLMHMECAEDFRPFTIIKAPLSISVDAEEAPL